MNRSVMVKGLRDAVCTAVRSSSTQELVETALPGMIRTFGGTFGLMYRIREDGLESWVPSSMPDPMAEYGKYYSDSCPFQAIKRRHNPRVAIISDMLDPSTVRTSAALNEFFYPRQYHRQLVARIGPKPYGEPGCVGLVLSRSSRAAPWHRQDAEDLRGLVPLLTAVVERNDRLAAAERGSDLLATVLDAPDCAPTLLFDRSARLVWMSRSAERLLADHLGRRTDLDAPFRAAVHGVRALVSSEDLPESITLNLEGRGGAGRLRASLWPTTARASGEPFVLVRLAQVGPSPALLDRGARKFDLSPAERAVIAVLMEGASNAEIARRISISSDTVRTHLKHVYDKLGVHSRVQAVVKMRELGWD